MVTEPVEGVLLLFRAISESIRKYMAQRKKVELEKQLDQFYRINKIMIIFLDICLADLLGTRS